MIRAALACLLLVACKAPPRASATADFSLDDFVVACQHRLEGTITIAESAEYPYPWEPLVTGNTAEGYVYESGIERDIGGVQRFRCTSDPGTRDITVTLH